LIKLLIADDQVIFRESLKFLIQQNNDIDVLGCVSNGHEVISFCKQNLPDLILMDLSMPVCDGIECTKVLKSKYRNIKILVLTTFDDNRNILSALKYGADGYILKDANPEELIAAIKSVNLGIKCMYGNTLNATVDNISITNITGNSLDLEKYNLSEKEAKIIGLIANGKSNKEIAKLLDITEGSVKNIITKILKKTKLQARIQLAIFAVQNGLF